MNDIPKIIFSRKRLKDFAQVDRMSAAFVEAKARNSHRHGITPTTAVLQSWAEPTVARGDLAQEILGLKEQPGQFHPCAWRHSVRAKQFAAGLIDEYRLGMHPVVWGQGRG